MGHISVVRALGTSNIVPGMLRDHAASIPGAGGRPGTPQRALMQMPIFFSEN